jgi:hypothetical protein
MDIEINSPSVNLPELEPYQLPQYNADVWNTCGLYASCLRAGETLPLITHCSSWNCHPDKRHLHVCLCTSVLLATDEWLLQFFHFSLSPTANTRVLIALIWPKRFATSADSGGSSTTISLSPFLLPKLLCSLMVSEKVECKIMPVPSWGGFCTDLSLGWWHKPSCLINCHKNGDWVATG